MQINSSVLHALIEFAAREDARFVRSPSLAKGNCGALSYRFAMSLPWSEDVEIVELEDPNAAPPHNAHFVVEVNGLWIDWTARQYDASAPWPFITPSDVSIVPGGEEIQRYDIEMAFHEGVNDIHNDLLPDGPDND